MNVYIESKTQENILATLVQELASTTHADTAAHIILQVADKLIGWEACYLILYDPAQASRPRPLLTIDTIEGKRITQKNAAPEKASENMLKAIQQGGFLSLHDKHFDVDASLAFGNKNKRTLSQMFVPVISGTRTIGVLSIQSYQANQYNKNQLDVLKNLAGYCASALERIWAQEALSDMVERLKVLHQAVRDINAGFDIERVCQVLYETVIKVMPCNDFVVDGYNQKTNEILPIFAIQHPHKRVFTQKYFADHGLAGEIVRSRKPIIFNSMSEMEASPIQFEYYGNLEEPDPTESILAVPMLLHDEMYGMISAQSHHKDSYNNDDQYLLEVLASHAAIAIENTRLFDSLQQVAYTDVLTSTLNRRRFYELTEIEYSRSKASKQPFALMMIDIDDFKKFNDQYGHKVGDLVLIQAAETCKCALRGTDIFGRLGGEEFALALPNTNLEEASQIASRLCKQIEQLDFTAVQETFNIQDKKPLSVTISVGIAMHDTTCKNLDMLIDHADQAMYLAKNLGRNQVHLWAK